MKYILMRFAVPFDSFLKRDLLGFAAYSEGFNIGITFPVHKKTSKLAVYSLSFKITTFRNNQMHISHELGTDTYQNGQATLYELDLPLAYVWQLLLYI